MISERILNGERVVDTLPTARGAGEYNVWYGLPADRGFVKVGPGGLLSYARMLTNGEINEIEIQGRLDPVTLHQLREAFPDVTPCPFELYEWIEVPEALERLGEPAFPDADYLFACGDDGLIYTAIRDRGTGAMSPPRLWTGRGMQETLRLAYADAVRESCLTRRFA